MCAIIYIILGDLYSTQVPLSKQNWVSCHQSNVNSLILICFKIQMIQIKTITLNCSLISKHYLPRHGIPSKRCNGFPANSLADEF